MTLSPPTDGAIIFFWFASIVMGVVALVSVFVIETVIFYMMGWGGLAGSLLLSVVVNTLSVIMTWIPSFLEILVRGGPTLELRPWVLLFLLSTFVESVLCHVIVKDVREVLKGCLIANLSSYLFLYALSVAYLMIT